MHLCKIETLDDLGVELVDSYVNVGDDQYDSLDTAFAYGWRPLGNPVPNRETNTFTWYLFR